MQYLYILRCCIKTINNKVEIKFYVKNTFIDNYISISYTLVNEYHRRIEKISNEMKKENVEHQNTTLK